MNKLEIAEFNLKVAKENHDLRLRAGDLCLFTRIEAEEEVAKWQRVVDRLIAAL
jgi:hypothetical protein